MKLTLGFSPCPNDTFIFDGMVNGLIDTKGIDFDYVMEDVETLNEMAYNGQLDITKISYGSYLHLTKTYALLHAGSALGKGVGPLLVSKKPISFEQIKQYSIAIPGINTTANLLLSMAVPEATNKSEIIFSDIEKAVLSEQFDIGLIIHENRFTYEKKGLCKIIDLGDWWENTMQAAIPLGGIVMKRDFNRSIIAEVDNLIQKSILNSWKNYPDLSDFVQKNAQEMDEEIMRKHIELYVNEWTTELGIVGEHSIQTLFKKAKNVGLIDHVVTPDHLFY